MLIQDKGFGKEQKTFHLTVCVKTLENPLIHAKKHKFYLELKLQGIPLGNLR